MQIVTKAAVFTVCLLRDSQYWQSCWHGQLPQLGAARWTDVLSTGADGASETSHAFSATVKADFVYHIVFMKPLDHRTCMLVRVTNALFSISCAEVCTLTTRLRAHQACAAN